MIMRIIEKENVVVQSEAGKKMNRTKTTSKEPGYGG